MSMTYYAVTDDPNELAHYGILGMKWGVRNDKPRHTGSRRPRSAAYKKAQSKLGRMMKSGIKKAEAHWKTYNSPKAKEERFMKKAMQQARNGTLKYGKLTDDQVRKVTDRLYLERQARQLGNTENPRFGKRIKSAIGTGIVEGLGRGTSAYIEERFRGRGRTTADFKAQKRKEKYEAKERTIRREAKKNANREYYEEQARNGTLESKVKSAAKLTVARIADPTGKYITASNSRNNLTQKGRAAVMRQKRLDDQKEERAKRQRELRDNAYYTAYGKLTAEKRFGSSSTPKSLLSGDSSSTTKDTTSTDMIPIYDLYGNIIGKTKRNRGRI